jgi:hypothetical protein
MDEGSPPVVGIRGRFVDEVAASEVAAAVNRWFGWILDGSPDPVPEILEPLGVQTSEWAWKLGEDVDWEFGPHARAVGPEVLVALETRDTYLRLAGLLRRLGAISVHVERDA